MIYSPKQLANQLRLLRLQHNWTQEDVAKRVGVKQSTISNFENNPDKIQLITLFKILQALKVELQIVVQSQKINVEPEDDEDW
ncbi:type II toxin-antitoxin system antitoxin HipB [Photobacterium sp. J15]|uniref:type II toxin-antitoxin system antitoxin HipB n=1 Tax=Photobacterium sp. J15 TaxID=265901 RepID=UPI0007E3C5CB|nr:type II toxin-antitoxin system antitoxin HipB [Photobacterium sp. J15]